jgi:hypothetical protein
LEIIVLNSEIPDKVYDTLRTEAKVKADFYANKASESKPRLSGNYIDVWKECEGNVRKFIEIYTKDTNPERYNRLTNTYNLFKDGLEGKGIEQGIGTAANESLGAGVSKYETEVAKDAARKDAMYTLLGLFTETVDSETNKGMHPSFGFVLREAAENEVREYLMNRREETLKSHEMSAK